MTDVIKLKECVAFRLFPFSDAMDFVVVSTGTRFSYDNGKVGIGGTWKALPNMRSSTVTVSTSGVLSIDGVRWDSKEMPVAPSLKRKAPDDPYDLLGLKPGCSKQDATKAFRKLSAIYHPDKMGVNDSDMFLRLTAARDAILSGNVQEPVAVLSEADKKHRAEFLEKEEEARKKREQLAMEALQHPRVSEGRKYQKATSTWRRAWVPPVRR